jgi:hypothetical protein
MNFSNQIIIAPKWFTVSFKECLLHLEGSGGVLQSFGVKDLIL